MLAVKFGHKKLKEKVQMVPRAEPGTKKKKKTKQKKPWKSEHWGAILSFFYYMSTLVNLKISFYRRNYRLLVILRNFKVRIQISILLSFRTF